MIFLVQWLPEAEADLERLFDALNEKNSIAASKASRLIFTAGASLSVSPYRGRLIDGTQQRKLQVPFGKYGYVLYYRVEGDRVFILRVHHGRENRF
jgi:plasmid stabilization system protein ParE